MADTLVKNDVHIIQERIIHTIECNFMQEEINKMSSDLKANGMQFKENLNDFMTKTDDNIQNINNKLKEQDNRMIDMSEINMKMFKDAEDSRGVIEINQIMNDQKESREENIAEYNPINNLSILTDTLNSSKSTIPR